MKRASAAVALSLCALASCRQIIGLDDRDATHDAGADVVVVTGSGPRECPTEDAAFCDDFDDPTRDAGWITILDHPPENDGGAVGMITIEPADGPSPPNALRVQYVSFKSDNGETRFNNARLAHDFHVAETAELSFSFKITTPSFPVNASSHQFALMNLAAGAVFPSIEPDGRLVFGYPTDLDGATDFPSRDSSVPLTFDAWHTMTMSINSKDRLIRCTLDGQEAFRELYNAAGADGGYVIAVGQRTPFFGYTAALEVRYDDVIVRTQ